MKINKVPEVSDLRSFAWILSVFFLLIFGIAIPYWKYKELNFIFFWISGFLLLCSMVYPKILLNPYKFWMLIGLVLGFINTRIILSFIYFLVFTPVALVKRIFGKDSMDRKWKKNENSYRIRVKQRPVEHMERPF
jgi:hypothetical protein